MGGGSTSSVPEPQVDDVAIHGDVGAEVVEHRRDVVLSEIQIACRAPSVLATRELINAHCKLTIPIQVFVPEEERDRDRCSRTNQLGFRNKLKKCTAPTN